MSDNNKVLNGLDFSVFGLPGIYKPDLDGVVYSEESETEIATVPINADTFGGKLPTEFAPAGYGLGVESKLLTSADDLNNIKANGWYMWYTNNAPANFPAEYAWREFQACRVWTFNGGVCMQEIVDMGSNPHVAGVRVQRTIYGTEYIGEWEVENPPMFVGVAYRTTERYNGKAVYYANINFGALPNNSRKTCYANILDGANFQIVGGLTAKLSSGVLVNGVGYDANNHVSGAHIMVTSFGGAIAINTDYDASSVTAEVFYKFTID